MDARRDPHLDPDLAPRLAPRLDRAKALAREAGRRGARLFADIGKLRIERKGVQDHVSNADIELETMIREGLAEAFPDDGIVGEEHEDREGRSGFTWVIDPIDGTANFIRGIPDWCVVLACVHDDRTVIGVVDVPVTGELFWGATGEGAHVGDKPIAVATAGGIDDGSVGVGMNNRTPAAHVAVFIERLVGRGGIFYRNASGALMLSYVAAGRLIGYAEPHMNAWDCLAGQLLVAEAGGGVEPQSAETMLREGGRVVAAAPAVFADLVAMADEAFR